jgi:hypothetical protein
MAFNILGFVLGRTIAKGQGVPNSTTTSNAAASFGIGSLLICRERIVLNWKPVPGAVKYEVFRNGARLGETTANSFAEEKPHPPDGTWYRIFALDKKGEQIAKFVLICATKSEYGDFSLF